MDYSNAQGYGFWCGKKCVAKKQAQGIPPKNSGRGGKHDIAWQQLQSEQMRATEALAGDSGSGGSKAPLIIGGLLLVGTIITIVIIRSRK